jgi:hypothetical protein
LTWINFIDPCIHNTGSNAMSALRYSKMTDPGRWRRGFAVLAFLALSILLARPVCNAMEPANAAPGFAHAGAAFQDLDTGHSDHESGLCCVSVDEASPLPTAGMAAPSGKGSAEPLPAAKASLRRAIAAPWQVAGHRSLPPPLSLPYHARTARILA